MSILTVVSESLGLKTALKLAVMFFVLTVVAGVIITTRQVEMMEELTMEKAKLAARSGARQYGEALENAIDQAMITAQDAFDRNYVEIRGFDWNGKTKYHTRYDWVTDRACLLFQDRFLENDPDFRFAIGVDENGYLPTHNSIYQKKISNDPQKDLAGNRTKRIFNDPVGLAAGRSLEDILIQDYKRDTGEHMWDVSAPIVVKGRHWGGFRVAVSLERIEQRKGRLISTLIGMFSAFMVLLVGATLVMLRQALQPVVELTRAAEQISMGEDLDRAIRPRSNDEIGKLTKTIDRLRVSMKAAMSRLGE
jgi:HAMP domain-containing protein